MVVAHMNWLLKEEPANYAFDALMKDKRTVWSGVRNPVAQKHLHAVKKGDRLFYYHTGNEKSVVGIAEALTDAYPDPNDNLGKSAVVDIGPVRKLARPVTLAEIKSDTAFKDFALVRISRLSVMPVTDEQWERIEEKASGPAGSMKRGSKR
jgi:predicted RNA-binding protein with PUA-like domain